MLLLTVYFQQHVSDNPIFPPPHPRIPPYNVKVGTPVELSSHLKAARPLTFTYTDYLICVGEREHNDPV